MIEKNNSFIEKGKLPLHVIVYIFLFLFCPPVLPGVNIIIPLSFITLLILLCKYRTYLKQIISKAFIDTYVNNTILFVFFLLAVIFINCLFFERSSATNYITTVYRFFLLVPCMTICIVYILVKIECLNLSFEEVILCIIIAGLFQSFLAMTSLLFPKVRAMLIDFMYLTTKNPVLQQEFHVQRRFFGFANSMLDNYGYGTGILAALPFYIAARGKSRYLIFVPLLFIVPFLNARTGIVIFLIGMAFSVPAFLKYLDSNKIYSLTKIIVILFIVVLIIAAILKSVVPTTYQWAIKGIASVFKLLKGDGSQIEMQLLFRESFWKAPKKIHLFFGAGSTVLGSNTNVSSDVGYINDIWMVGIVGMLFLYFIFIRIGLKAYQSTQIYSEKLMMLFLIISFFIGNIKAILYNFNTGSALTYLVFFTVIYFNNTQTKHIKQL